jgi:dinuclear metal center YbgI/SA1388 family protein
MAHRDKIIAAMDKYLDITRFQDYAPIGLQVEGADKVSKIVTGVSLSMALLEGARESKAQMVLVHHGTFWKNDSPVLRGPQKKRIAFLLNHDISLVAYHLPLDAHPTVGNNAQICKMLGARRLKGFGDYNGNLIGFAGAFDGGKTIHQIMDKLDLLSEEKGIYFPGRSERIRRVGVVSGGAGGMFEQAVREGLDLYVTGEPWEPAQALSRETGVGFLALGHYNSEKPGIMALGAWLKKRFKVGVEFIDIPNPA